MRTLTLTAQDVANYFLAKVDEEAGDNLSNLKLQKLLYYAQGFHLAMFGEPLFPDPMEAGRFGPVVPDLYRKYKHFGAEALPRPPVDEFDPSRYDERTRELLDEVSAVFDQFSAVRLMRMAQDEPPWIQADLDAAISLSAMQDYFKTRLADG